MYILLLLPSYYILRHFEFKYGIHLNTNIKVGKGLLIVHGNGVYLNCAEIGENFTVYQNVTLGMLKGGIPTVGNGVTVYTGAVVAGGIMLEDGCVVGANAYVDHTVSMDQTVVGVPARAI